ncbi:MAG TPA: Do family serine endopeptidase [Rhizomicrobium sp.]|nr:Do family serine endopeptidase [Rhizomicrobium sp.]
MDTVEKKDRKTRSTLGVLSIAALLAGGGIAGFAAARATEVPPPLSVPHVGKQAGFAALVATVKPAVVNISTTERVEPSAGNQLDENGPMGDMLRQFFGPNAEQLFRQQSQKPTHALGSGFIIDPAGYIVTNNHVIDDATDIQVTLTDGSIHAAHIVGRDKQTDLALLKIDVPHPLAYVSFGDSKQEQVGDWVVAVGNPYGLGGSVSAGIVSARNRDINEGPYDDFLQIDAPINPGNSGGPLFDQSGHVIGIDTAIYTPSGGSVGIGFAIPSDVASKVVAQLRAHGHVTRGWLGVQMQAVTPALAKAIGLNKVEGVLVDLVTPDSPAAHGGIRQGDVITAFNGEHIATMRDLSFAVADVPAGKTVDVSVWRNGQQRELNVTVGTEHAEKMASAAAAANRSPVGLELQPVPADERDQYDIQGGAVVAGVTPGSRADQSGLQAGDVILRVGDHKVNSPGDAASQIHSAEASHRPSVALLVMRNGTTSYLPLQLGTASG